MVKVSVIVPVYNVEKYLGRCLNSLLEQTLDDLEIIVIDDGSTDSSSAIAEKYSMKYPNKLQLYRMLEIMVCNLSAVSMWLFWIVMTMLKKIRTENCITQRRKPVRRLLCVVIQRNGIAGVRV